MKAMASELNMYQAQVTHKTHVPRREPPKIASTPLLLWQNGFHDKKRKNKDACAIFCNWKGSKLSSNRRLRRHKLRLFGTPTFIFQLLFWCKKQSPLCSSWGYQTVPIQENTCLLGTGSDNTAVAIFCCYCCTLLNRLSLSSRLTKLPNFSYHSLGQHTHAGQWVQVRNGANHARTSRRKAQALRTQASRAGAFICVFTKPSTKK